MNNILDVAQTYQRFDKLILLNMQAIEAEAYEYLLYYNELWC